MKWGSIGIRNWWASGGSRGRLIFYFWCGWEQGIKYPGGIRVRPGSGWKGPKVCTTDRNFLELSLLKLAHWIGETGETPNPIIT